MYKKERRQKRVSLNGVAEVKVGSDGKSFLCTARPENMSLAGMGLYMHHVLKQGTPVSIKLRVAMKDGTRPTEIVKGSVTSVSDMGSFYCVGVRFDRPVNPEEQPHLYPHLVSDEG